MTILRSFAFLKTKLNVDRKHAFDILTVIVGRREKLGLVLMMKESTIFKYRLHLTSFYKWKMLNEITNFRLEFQRYFQICIRCHIIENLMKTCNYFCKKKSFSRLESYYVKEFLNNKKKMRNSQKSITAIANTGKFPESRLSIDDDIDKVMMMSKNRRNEVRKLDML